MKSMDRYTLFAGVPLAVLAAAAGAGRGAAPRPAAPADTVRPPAAVAPPPAAPALPPPMTLMPATLDAGALRRAESAVRAQVARGAFPGAALAVGRGGRTVLERGIGRLAPGEAEVDPARTVYDLASLTKVVATTTAAMLLVEDGRLELDAPVSRYLPEFRGGSKGRVTVRHLLAHTSGLPAGSGGRSLARVVATPLQSAPGTRVVYSDVNMVVLFAAVERAAGEPLPGLLRRRVWEPLGMASTGFSPGAGCRACAPTGRSRAFRGLVHDPIARRLGGVAGNAGLFSTAHDLGRFAAMLAGGGTLDGVRVLKPETVREFTRRQPGARTRALGWDTRGPAFQHTGFTGTSLWVDPERGVWTVLLTNRTYASSRRNPLPALRRVVHRWVGSAAADGSGEYAASRG
ncbi:MAG: serine hydrolase domain-containing protein [Gemmatimonadota bacterium]